MLPLALFALLSASIVHAEEPCEATHADVVEATDQAFESFLEMDVDGFGTHADAAEAALECLREPLSPAQAAEYHRLQALASFLARDQDGAVARFRASRVLAPDARLPEEIAPGGHPLDGLYRRANPDESGAIAPLAPPEGGRVWVDGTVDAQVRPVDRPAVIQLAGPDEVVVRSEYVLGSSSGPDWDGVRFGAAPREPAPATDAAPESAAEPAGPRHVVDVQTTSSSSQIDPGRRAAPMVVVATVAAVTSASCYAAASSSRASFDDPATSFDELDGLRARTNSLVAVSGVAAGAAVGFGIGAFTIVF